MKKNSIEGADARCAAVTQLLNEAKAGDRQAAARDGGPSQAGAAAF